MAKIFLLQDTVKTMNIDLIVVLAMLMAAIVAFMINKPRMDFVALTVIAIFPLTGILTVNETLAGFSDSSIILIAAFFIIGDSLVRTGIAYSVGTWLIKQARNNETRLLILLMGSVALLGSVMSSTGIVAIFIPVVLSIAAHMQADPRRLMMPLSFAGLISGMLTLVATAPNLVVSSHLEQVGFAPFSFFSFTPIGLIILLAGIIYMLCARKWLNSEKHAFSAVNKAQRNLVDLIKDYKLSGRNRRLRINHGSLMIAKTLADLQLRARFGANVIGVERLGRLSHKVMDASPNLELKASDILLIDFFYKETVDDFCNAFNLTKLAFKGDYFTDQSRSIGMAEVSLPPESKLIGKTILEIGFRSIYQLNVVGLRRNGQALDNDLTNENLKLGDTLLVIGTWKAIKQLQTLNQDFLVLSLPAEINEVAPNLNKAPYALITLAITVGLMISGLFPNVIIALVGCLLMGAFRCIDMDSAYRSIHWPSLILIIGMFPFATALHKTGGINLAVDGLLAVVGNSNPHLLIASLFILTATIGLFISNTATAILLAPIAVNAAEQVGASPYPFAMTVAIAASAAFMTPVSSPVNTLVVGPGCYKFSDFIKIGVPFTLIVLIICVIFVPILFPLHPNY